MISLYIHQPACIADKVAGYVTLLFTSGYPGFSIANIPEIKDLNVLPQFRHQGVGSKLLDVAEEAAFKRANRVGIGVGLYADYGAAQRLYVRRGYIPDGHGAMCVYDPVTPGEAYQVDDDLILYFTKKKR